MFMNAFDKKFALAFYNSFLKAELNYDKINNVNFKYMQFSKENLHFSTIFNNSKENLQNILYYITTFLVHMKLL